MHDRKTMTDAIFADIAKGTLVVDAIEPHGITRETLNRWCVADPALGDAYARAREQQSHALAEQALRIAHGSDELTSLRADAIEVAAEELAESNPKNWRKIVNALENNLIQRDRLRVDTLKWMTSKIAPRLYGERLDVTTGGKSMAVTGVVVIPAVE